jgi:WD40 repeat protein
VASVRRHAVVRFAAMDFLILGPLEVSDDGRKLALGGPKQRAVLAHLILRANRIVQADQLIDGLWGEEPPESAGNTLQTYVYRLRKLLRENRIEGRDGGYVLVATPTRSTPCGSSRSSAPYVIDWDGGRLVKLRDEPGVVLSWTPDGRRIMVGGDASFLTVRPDGSDKRVFLEDPPEDGVLALDWSPDGRWIVMSPSSGLGSTLYLMRADGSQLFRIGFGMEPSCRPETP